MIKDELMGLIKEAMKAKDAARLNALRDIKKSIQDWTTSKEAIGKEYTEDVEVKILQKLAKQCKDSIEQCTGDSQQTAKDTLSVVKEFLPAEITEEQIIDAINSARETIELTEKTHGMFIGKVKKIYPTADGALIKSIITKMINK